MVKTLLQYSSKATLVEKVNGLSLFCALHRVVGNNWNGRLTIGQLHCQKT